MQRRWHCDIIDGLGVCTSLAPPPSHRVLVPGQMLSLSHISLCIHTCACSGPLSSAARAARPSHSCENSRSVYLMQSSRTVEINSRPRTKLQ